MLSIIGITCALTTFFGVWLGHIAVRRIEFNARNLTFPILTVLILGLGCGIFSALTENFIASGALGIVGFTLLWDALEFVRQERRICKGHAPANPNNPRHVHILQTHPSATTCNMLKRDPRGLPYSSIEIESILEGRL